MTPDGVAASSGAAVPIGEAVTDGGAAGGLPTGMIETADAPSTIKRGAPPIRQPPVQDAPANSMMYLPLRALIL
jgi:hypothetical protein